MKAWDIFSCEIQKTNLLNRRGAVSAERKRQIIMTINRVNGWL